MALSNTLVSSQSMLIPRMLSDGRLLSMSLAACILNLCFQPSASPLRKPYHTGRGSDRPLLPVSPWGGEGGSFTLVRSERRVGPNLKTTFRPNFSQAFLIRSLKPDTYGIITIGGFSCGSSSSGSSVCVDGFCMEEMERMNGKG